MTNQKIFSLTFIGAGKMAEAIFSGLIAKETLSSSNIVVSDPSHERLSSLKENYKVNTFLSNKEALRKSLCHSERSEESQALQNDMDEGRPVILAVKPQQIASVLDEIKESVENRLVISVAAGIEISQIESKLSSARVIRVMPNTAALVGEAITAISKGSKATESDMDVAEMIFGAIGKTVRVKEEFQNAVTAISGSGPAYFFYLTEALINSGVIVGLTRQESYQLATQTAIGAGALLKTGQDPAELRKMVTSPGGTTQAAIESFEENNLSGIVEKAVQKAFQRAVELSRENYLN